MQAEWTRTTADQAVHMIVAVGVWEGGEWQVDDYE
jgi:hypothetical protein